ncbi:MAG: hypothetical protein DRP12_03320 [Candidatus Aenigmatarchaeota archaeon]|nr:MAG: hypothetical protein DRP12_03320 [Candidatus Aenigmarchaeota archaeon]
MASYSRGTRRERIAKEILERSGYEVVRAAGSHGRYDLVAIGEEDIRLIQVKSVKPSERIRQKYLEGPDGKLEVKREIWVWLGKDAFRVISKGGEEWIVLRYSTE